MRKPTSAARRQILESVGAPIALHPVLAELFAGLDSLGSVPKLVTGLLDEGGVGPRSRVLDLASGKGSASLDAAATLGSETLGIDACDEFVQAAKAAALEQGLPRCRFRVGDVREVRGRYDAAVMIGLFGAAEAAALLRRRVRPGGVYIFDDAVLIPRHPDAGAYSEIPTLAAVREMIETAGDRVIRARLISAPEVRAMAARSHAVLSRNAKTIVRDRPRYRRAITRFLADQRRSALLLQGPLRPALVLERRA